MNGPILIGILGAVSLWGQVAPGRVGRLGYVYGDVSFRPDSAEEWAQAVLNEPLSDGDILRTGADAQAEVYVAATAVHLAPETVLAIVRLDDRLFRVKLTLGALNVRIPRLNEGE